LIIEVIEEYHEELVTKEGSDVADVLVAEFADVIAEVVVTQDAIKEAAEEAGVPADELPAFDAELLTEAVVTTVETTILSEVDPEVFAVEDHADEIVEEAKEEAEEVETEVQEAFTQSVEVIAEKVNEVVEETGLTAEEALKTEEVQEVVRE
jgi:hypothetical protein